jgi:hypothetical protein
MLHVAVGDKVLKLSFGRNFALSRSEPDKPLTISYQQILEEGGEDAVIAVLESGLGYSGILEAMMQEGPLMQDAVKVVVFEGTVGSFYRDGGGSGIARVAEPSGFFQKPQKIQDRQGNKGLTQGKGVVEEKSRDTGLGAVSQQEGQGRGEDHRTGVFSREENQNHSLGAFSEENQDYGFDSFLKGGQDSRFGFLEEQDQDHGFGPFLQEDRDYGCDAFLEDDHDHGFGAFSREEDRDPCFDAFRSPFE